MPEITEYKISDLTTAAQVDESDFVELSQENQNVSGGRISLKATILAIANKIANGINFTSALQTTDKTIVGAINEVSQGGGGSDVEVTPILTEGTKIATITVDEEDTDIYGENTKEELEKLSAEKTVNGNPVTFETINGGMAKSCEVSFAPIQDLHGYDHPWAGGNGKNKIDQSTITKLLRNGAETSSGITNSDGEITVTYTYGNQGSYSLSQVVPIHSGEITISADFMVVGSSGSAQIRTNVGNNTSSISATPTPNKTITLSAFNTWENKSVTYELNEQASDGITIALQASASGNQLKIKNLQVEIGSTATSYAPYENICPISGWDSVDVVISDGETAQTKTITFPSTVYGGNGNIVDGNWNNTMSGKVDMGTLNWAYGNNVFNVIISDKANTYFMYCSVYKPTNKSRGELENGELGVYSTGMLNRIAIRDDNYTNATDFKTAVTGQDLCYELATPTPFSTEPTNIELQKGTNNISTDADSIEIKYSEMMTIDDVKMLIDAEGGAIDYSTEEAEVPNFTFFGEKVYVKAFTFSNVNIGGAIALMTAPSYIGHIVKAWMYTTNEGGVEFTSFPAVWVHEGDLYINPYYNSTAVTGKIVLYYTKTS